MIKIEHILDEWNLWYPGSFCQWITTLPYSELITGSEVEATKENGIRE